MKKIRHILYFGTALLLAGCSGDERLTSDTLSGDGQKTPLLIEASLGTGNGVTRAAGKNFTTGDVLLAYLRHVTISGAGTQENPYVYTPLAGEYTWKQRLVSFTKGNKNMDVVNDHVKSTSDLTVTGTPLYWDDFSVGSKGDATDIRTINHGLQSFYGYCYNGGTPSKKLTDDDHTEADGIIQWTIGDQTTAVAVQNADLLWSAEQDAVTYEHAATQAGAHGTMTIPYTHAMSEVTVTITARYGYETDADPLHNTVLTLNAMNTVTSFTAPQGTFTSIHGDENANIKSITMYGETYTGKTRNYTAIVGPGTKLKEGVKLLDITNVADNDYTVAITGTSGMLKNDAWATDHTVYDNDDHYILTKPGVNYHLNITVDKAVVLTEATLQDWTTVDATGTGVIQYPNDAVTMNVTGDNYAENSKFSLFWQQTNGTANDEASERTNATYTYATISSYASSTWTNTPTIYWPNKTNQYYFRALAQYNSTTNDVHSITSVGTYDSNKGTAVSQGTIAAGHDILWGTTPTHTGSPNSNSFTAGQAIPPRTGNVPIAFEHAMSKLTFQLETTNDVSVTVNNAKVDLTDATIAISNLAISGTISIETGDITPAATTAEAITATVAPISNLIVIPQTIGNTANVTITLKDGTTYKLQLNLCKDGSNAPITAWERGKHYTYTIHLEKEQISFRALVKDWYEVTGSGEANLEWD